MPIQGPIRGGAVPRHDPIIGRSEKDARYPAPAAEPRTQLRSRWQHCPATPSGNGRVDKQSLFRDKTGDAARERLFKMFANDFITVGEWEQRSSSLLKDCNEQRNDKARVSRDDGWGGRNVGDSPFLERCFG